MRNNCCSATPLSLLAGVFAVILLMNVLPVNCRASEYDDLRKLYFTDRSVDYAQELLLREEYLNVLYTCTVEEVKARKREGIQPGLFNSPFADVEPIHFDRDNPELATADIAERYRLWVDYEEREYQRRLQHIMDLRRILIDEANEAQKMRMFRRELEKGMKYYGENDWDIATLLFKRLISDYQYNTIDDLLYYHSEASLQLKHYDAALADLIKILGENPQSTYRAKAYVSASAIMSNMGMDRDLIRLYQNYAVDGFPGDPVEMGGIHLRAAHAEAGFGHFENAIEILGRVPQKSPYYLASRYFLSDCHAALEDWASAVDVLTEMVDLKQGKMPYTRWRLLTDEAKIKLAFIYYEWEEYDKAAHLFNEIKSNSPFYDRVLMGKAWIAFQLDLYEDATATTEELLQTYPRSTEIYEAGSLTGYCYEQMGEKSQAMTYFYEVLDAGVGRSKLQTFLKERRRIMDALAELEALGENVFVYGNEESYASYKRARTQLILSLKRIGLAELLEANEGMKSLVAERILLDKLVQEHGALENTIEATNNRKLMGEFTELEDRIFTLMERLKAAGQGRLKETPLYYQEARVGHINTMADTLSARAEQEIEILLASIEEAEVRYQQAMEAGNTKEGLAYGLRLHELNEVLNNGYLHHVLAENSRRPVLKTRVDRWSDFSFSRYAMGGMEFDELERKYERLKQVEDYIATLDEMIEVPVEESPGPAPEIPEEENPSENLDNQTE